MKKILLIVTFVAVSMFAKAQFYVGGDVGFNKAEYNGETTTNFQIAPNLGYVLNDTWSFGLALGFADLEDEDFVGKQYSVTPYARCAFYKIGALKLFVDGVFDYLSLKPDAGESTNGWSVSIEPGVAYKLTDRLRLSAKIGSLSYSDIQNTTSYDFELSSELQFAMYYFF